MTVVAILVVVVVVVVVVVSCCHFNAGRDSLDRTCDASRLIGDRIAAAKHVMQHVMALLNHVVSVYIRTYV